MIRNIIEFLHYLWEEVPAGILTVGVITIVVILASMLQYSRDMEECIEDGHKEYECRALLKTYPAPTTYIYTK